MEAANEITQRGTGGAPRCAVILAGGDGSRLRSLTRAITGDERPKQFCPILDGETLLDITRQRVALGIVAENTFFSLNARHERYFRSALADVPRSRLNIQPENKGTTPAILYSLLQVAREHPDATVAFFPSDHYFSDDHAFMSNVDRAFAAAEINPSSLVLLGIEPDSAETSYGWIEPDESLFGPLSGSVTSVRRFWEKPLAKTARELMMRGCLWNSFVMVGKVATILEMIRRSLPDLFRLFAAAVKAKGVAQEEAAMRSVYAWINESNFSTEVLENCPQELYVMRVGNVTWSDLGEPQRVLGTLNGLGLMPDWMVATAA